MLRGRGAPRRRSEQKIALLHADRRRLRDRARRSGARLRGAGAGARRRSAEPGGAASVERLARALRRWTTWSDATGGWSASVADPERKNALYHRIARLAEPELGDDAPAARLPRGAGCLAARSRGGQRAGAALSAHLRLRQPGRAAAAQGRDGRRRRREEGAVLQGGAALRRGAREPREGDRRLPAGAVVDDNDATALDELERLYIRLERWEPSRTSTPRRRSWPPTPDEKKQMLFVLGQVYDRELEDPERAIETYSSIIDLDPEDFDAVQALDRLYQQTGRWYDLLAVLERQTELAPSTRRDGLAALPHRRAVARELKDLARAVEAYRDVLALDRRTSRRCGARRAGARQGRAGAGGAVLEPIYESAGEWERVIDVYEVMAAQHRGSGAQGGAAVTASPTSTSGGCRPRTRRSTRTAARCASIRATRT